MSPVVRFPRALLALASLCGLSLGCPPPDPQDCTSDACGGSSSTTGDPGTTPDAPTTSSPTDTATSTTAPMPTSTTAETTAEPTTTGVTATTTTTTDPETTATTSTPECDPEFGNDHCAAPTPYCVEGDCVSCVDVPCREVDPDKSACDEQTGLCVECDDNSDCAEASPFCEPDTATCTPCSQHEHCGAEVGGPGTACNLDEGTCFPGDDVMWVDNTPGAPVLCGDQNPGTEAMPVCHLSAALAKAMPGKPLTIKVRPGTAPQSEALVLNTAADVAIVSGTPQDVLITRAGPEDALDISGGARVYIHRLDFFNPMVGQTSFMIDCSGSTLWLDEVRISQTKVAVRTSECAVHIRRAVIHETSAGGVLVSDQSKLWLENSFITKNGSIHGLSITTGSSADILYSTFAFNSGIVAPIACTNTMAVITLRNSLIADLNDKYTTCNLTADEGNLRTNQDDLIAAGILASFEDGVLRGLADGALKDVAVWHAGDTRDDYDLAKVRPSTDGAPDYAGADVP